MSVFTSNPVFVKIQISAELSLGFKMYYGLFYSSLALVSLALFSVTGLPIPSPSPHSISHLNYVHGAFSDGNFLQYTVVHPPHPQHTFYNTNQGKMRSVPTILLYGVEKETCKYLTVFLLKPTAKLS